MVIVPPAISSAGPPSWIVAYTKLVAVSASLNVPAWAARRSRMESPTHLAGWAGGFAISPHPNEEARWMADASPATDKERCPVDVYAGYCGPAPPVVERSYGRARRLNGCQVVGRARRRSLVRTARQPLTSTTTAHSISVARARMDARVSLTSTALSRARPNRTYDHEGIPASLMDLASFDDRTSQSSPFGDAIDTFIGREDGRALHRGGA
jgi:hypothetical protein